MTNIIQTYDELTRKDKEAQIEFKNRYEYVKKEPAFHLICPKCLHKKTIYGPFPLSDFLKICNNNKYCDLCRTEIKNITALNSKTE